MHADLSQLACQFLRNKRSGTSEDALHGRDDALFEIICVLALMSPERNKVASSTQQGKRADGYLYKSGFPPLVIWEEKDVDGKLQAAKDDLNKKFFFLPHYGQLSSIVGVAIAGNMVSFGTLRDGFTQRASFDLNDTRQRIG